MATVATLRGKFSEFKPTKNPDYGLLVFQFAQEMYGQIFPAGANDRMPKTTILFNAGEQPELCKLNPGQDYDLQCSLSVKKANEVNGTFYPAQVQYNIIKAKPCT